MIRPQNLRHFRIDQSPMRFLSLRAIFLLGFVLAMPVLALPPVARRIDELLYGPPPTDFGRAPAAVPIADELTPPPQPSIVKPAAPRFDEPSPAASAVVQSSFTTPVNAPSLAPTPEFALTDPPRASHLNPATEPKIDPSTISKLQQIRERLEQLGADYVVVEVQDGGRYRFFCRMLVDGRSSFTKPFEAISFDALAAGEQVLRDVTAWRSAQ
jgi:hypothetical protein